MLACRRLYVDIVQLLPTMYLQHGPWTGTTPMRAALLALPRNKRCPDRYYQSEGKQPPGATGVPQHLARAEEQRKEESRRIESLQRKHQTRLDLDRQTQEAKLQASRNSHALVISQGRELAAQQRQAVDAELTASQKRHALAIAQGRERADEQYRQEDNKQRQTLQHDKQRALTQQATRHHTNEAAFKHRSRMLEVEQAADRDRTERARKVLHEQEEAMERQQRRRMQEIEYKAETDRAQVKMLSEGRMAYDNESVDWVSWRGCGLADYQRGGRERWCEALLAGEEYFVW